MLKESNRVSSEAIRNAIEGRDGRMLASFYTDNAHVIVVDRNNPPSRPREIFGKAAIGAFWEDICGRTMTHKVESTISEGNKIAFTQACTYPDGAKVSCFSVLDLENGKIARQRVVQAWDE
jgi:ketosteroid isomerase-like protein